MANRIGDDVLRMLAYNGSVPGPCLHVDQGSEVIIDVTNDGDVEATVHWHGLRLENRYDGVPHETQAPIPVGGTFTYRLQFPDPGLYWSAAQDRMATLSTNSLHRVVPATHQSLLVDESDSTFSARAIADVVRSIRTRSPLPSS
ncbi:MAG TPA: multicopper oxidase domain-containing protein [Acidimicrobiales bacterium]|nr:multicopper oxidase domain-containing protein [Acidimicrobiales bacterium]